MFLSVRLFTAHSFASDWGNPLTVCSVFWNETSQWFRHPSLRSCTWTLSHEGRACLLQFDRYIALRWAVTVPMCPSCRLWSDNFSNAFQLKLVFVLFLLGGKLKISILEKSQNKKGFFFRFVWLTLVHIEQLKYWKCRCYTPGCDT